MDKSLNDYVKFYKAVLDKGDKDSKRLIVVAESP